MLSEIWVHKSLKADLIKNLRKSLKMRSKDDLESLDEDALTALGSTIKKNSCNVLYGNLEGIKKGDIMILEMAGDATPDFSMNKLFNRLAVVKVFEDTDELKALNKQQDATVHAGLYSVNDEEVEEVIQDLNLGFITVNCLPETDYRIPEGSGANAQLGKFFGKYAFTNLSNMKPIFINST